MTDEWMKVVERPWIGMTLEPLTDLERAHAELAEDLHAIRRKLNIPARVRRRARTLRRRHPHGNAAVAAALGCVSVSVTAFMIVNHARRRRRHTARTSR